MATPSPLFRFNGGAVGAKLLSAAFGTVTAQLNDITGVDSVEWWILSTDESSAPSNYPLVITGPRGSIVTTGALAAGTAAILACRINGGIDRATQVPDPIGTVATAKFYVPIGTGAYEVGCAGEEMQSDPVYGSTGVFNQAIRGIALGTGLPGPTGPAGATGPTGPAGQSAWTVTTASYVQPAQGADVTVAVANSDWTTAPNVVGIATGGIYIVAAVPDSTHLTLTFSGQGQTAGSTIASGAKVVIMGYPGDKGATGPTGPTGKSAFGASTASFTQPPINSAASVTVTDTSWMVSGQILYLSTGGYYSVQNVFNPTGVNLTNLGYPLNSTAGNTVGAGLLTPAGIRGATGTAGPTGPAGAGRPFASRRTITGPDTAIAGELLTIDQGGGTGFAVFLPSASSVDPGSAVGLKTVNGTGGALVTPTGGDTIDGASNLLTDVTTMPRAILVSDGVSDWARIA